MKFELITLYCVFGKMSIKETAKKHPPAKCRGMQNVLLISADLVEVVVGHRHSLCR